MLRNIAICWFFIGLLGCSGYHVKKSNNPWSKFGVHHVTIPLFQNETLLPGINTAITAGIIRELQSFSGLQVTAGESHKADALLLGIVTGAQLQNEALKTTERIFLDDAYSSSLGERRGIYLPRQQRYMITVELYLIKNPTTFDVKLLRSNLRKYATLRPKILFKERMEVSQNVVRSLWGRETVDQGGVVNYTQSEGNLRRSYQVAADDIVRQFRELILYAF